MTWKRVRKIVIIVVDQSIINTPVLHGHTLIDVLVKHLLEVFVVRGPALVGFTQGHKILVDPKLLQ